MKTRTVIWVKGKPCNQKSPKILETWKTSIRKEAMKISKKNETENILSGDTELNFEFVFSTPLSKSPNVEKLIKSTLNALKGVVYRYDSQLLKIAGAKNYGDTTMSRIEIIKFLGDDEPHVFFDKWRNGAK